MRALKPFYPKIPNDPFVPASKPYKYAVGEDVYVRFRNINKGTMLTLPCCITEIVYGATEKIEVTPYLGVHGHFHDCLLTEPKGWGAQIPLSQQGEYIGRILGPQSNKLVNGPGAYLMGESARKILHHFPREGGVAITGQQAVIGCRYIITQYTDMLASGLLIHQNKAPNGDRRYVFDAQIRYERGKLPHFLGVSSSMTITSDGILLGVPPELIRLPNGKAIDM